MKTGFIKNTLLIITMSLGTVSSYANHRLHSIHNKYSARIISHRSHVAAIIAKQQAIRAQTRRKAARTTEVAERLIGISDYNITDSTLPVGINDSTWFKYSDARSSIFNYDHMDFDDNYYMGTDYIMGFGADFGAHDQNNNPSILFDTALYFSNAFSPIYLEDTFVIEDTRIAFYDSAYNITEYADLYLMDSSSAYDNNLFLTNYNTSEFVVNSLNMSWDYGVWDSSEYRYFSYNSLNLMIADSSSICYSPGSWTPFEKWDYTYDDSGNMINAILYDDSLGIWSETEQYFMRYNTSNLLTWDSASQLLSGVWVPQSSDTLGYMPGYTYSTYQMSVSDAGGVPASYLILSKHINGAGLPDTMYQSEFSLVDSTIIEEEKYSFNYDSYDEPILAVQYNFNIDSTFTSGFFDTSADYITHYYYETYTEREAHPNNVIAPQAPENIKVYPNPATDELSISWPGITLGSYTFIQLINATGQTVRTESLPWQNETESISTAGLIPGTYWLVIQDKSGNNVYRQAVVKQ